MQDSAGVPDYLWPTEFNILQQIQIIASNATDGDRFFIYYSGHGSQVPSKDDNEWDKQDERIATSDGKWILDNCLHDELILPLQKKNIRLFAFFDCCHGETLLDLGHDRKYTRIWKAGPGRLAKGKHQLQWTSGSCLIQITAGLFKSVPHLLRLARSKMSCSSKDKFKPQLLTNDSADTLIPGTVSFPVNQGSEETGFRAISLSACGDCQVAYDDTESGVTFTKIFLDVIGNKHVTWEELRDEMKERIKKVLQRNSCYLPPRRLGLDVEFDQRIQQPRVGLLDAQSCHKLIRHS
ncbi:peptidase C14, caspase domain-containing protein [Scleroderma yunnanense]